MHFNASMPQCLKLDNLVVNRRQCLQQIYHRQFQIDLLKTILDCKLFDKTSRAVWDKYRRLDLPGFQFCNTKSYHWITSCMSFCGIQKRRCRFVSSSQSKMMKEQPYFMHGSLLLPREKRKKMSVRWQREKLS